MLDPTETTECPFCAEMVSIRAKKCCHCGEIIDPVLRMVEEQKRRLEKNEAGTASPAVVHVAPPVVVTQTPVVAQTPVAPPKQRSTFIILGVFLGCLGIHNFYAGYEGKGLAQLLITLFLGWLIIPLLLVGIWAIVEICIIDKTADGKPLI